MEREDKMIRPHPTYVARYAILLYGYSFEGADTMPMQWAAHDGEKDLMYATAHRIHDGKICEGSPVTKAFLENLSLQFSKPIDESPHRGHYFPPEVVFYCESTKDIAWWSPASTKRVLFHPNHMLKSGTAKIPAVLFTYFKGHLYVYALRENRRPELSTTLYHSFFFNNGCMGNVKVPDIEEPADIHKIEALFYESEFTIALSPLLAKGYTATTLWQRLIKTKKPFPKRALLPQTTLARILNIPINEAP